jgi:hypothetical protein
MSKIFNIAIAVCVGLLLILIVDPASANTVAKLPPSEFGVVSDDVLEQRIQNLSSQLDLRLTPEVKKYIYDYTVKHRYSAEDFLGRSGMYFPMFQEKLSEKGLPEEIKCLAIVESNLKPTAVSPYGATGLWQFIQSTGEMYNLDKNKYVDDRRDPVKSTEAAADFLLDLYHKYNDWTLALAAYNCGPGNVNKAMRKSGENDYWSIRKYLPRETQKYIPKLVAIIYVTQYYYEHNLTPKEIETEFQNTRTAKVWEGLSFAEVQKISGLSMDVIKKLNPQYLRNYVPHNNGENLLTLPENEMFDVAYSEKTQIEVINIGNEIPLIPEETVESDIADTIAESQASEKINISSISSTEINQLVVAKSNPIHFPEIKEQRSLVAISSNNNRKKKQSYSAHKEHVIIRARR